MTDKPLPAKLAEKLRKASALIPDDTAATNGHATPPASPSPRRAFICMHAVKGVRDCSRRTFLLPDEPDHIPDCPTHGAMSRQPNRAYLGNAT